MHSNHLKKSLLALAVGQLISHGAQAAHILVDNTGDDGEGCTFREAVISLTNAALEPGCRQAASAFGTRDRILFSVPSVTLNSEVVVEKELAINPFTQDPPVTINGDGSDRLLSIRNSTVSINKTTLSGGSTSGFGGGLLVTDGSTLSLTESTVSDNQANSYGGGIFVDVGSTLTLSNSTVSDNQSGSGGGGITAGSGTLELLNSTVSGNTARFTGGGIYNNGGITSVVNTTISLNKTLLSSGTISSGGGIYQRAGELTGELTLINATVSGNRSGRGSGGGVALNSARLSLNNSLIVGNQTGSGRATQLAITTFVPSLDSNFNLFTNGGGNAFSRFSPSNTDITVNAAELGGLDQILLPLADNGGPTLTHALPEGSPAIDAADNAGCAAEPINNLDQRGEMRDEQCDIGAVEFFEPDPEPDGTFFVVPTKNGKSVIVEL